MFKDKHFARKLDGLGFNDEGEDPTWAREEEERLDEEADDRLDGAYGEPKEVEF